jgi:L-arabinose transport system substrate-binding protein
MWRLTLALAAGVLVGSMLGGCQKQSQDGNTPAGRQKIKIGFLVKQPEEPWFQHEWKFADQAGAKYGFEVIKIGVPDGEKVLTAIDNLAAQGAKGFIICTPDVRLGPAIVDAARRNNLKLFSVDDRFLGSDGKAMMDVHYMGISARKIGNTVGETLAAEMKNRHWDPNETSAMGIGLEELETARQRLEGATESLVNAGLPKSRIYTGLVRGLADVNNAFAASDVVLTQHSNVKYWLVFGMNDESVLGGIRALEGRGIGADRTIGVGIGGSTGMADWQMEKPTGFFAAVLISPQRHGFETAEYMYKWIKDGQEPPKETFTSGILIDRANYKKIMKEQGLLD